MEWLVRAVRLKDAGRAYKTVSFEREAYSNEDDPNYIENSNYFAWVKYLFYFKICIMDLNNIVGFKSCG